MKFEFLVATRYLKAKRKQAAISLITVIAIVGVAAGVAALVIAMAVSGGLRKDLRDRLLGAQAHVSVVARGADGIADYIKVAQRIQDVDGVIAASPYAYQGMFLSIVGSNAGEGVYVKGILPELESNISAVFDHAVEGDLRQLEGLTIAVGKELANALGIRVGDEVKLTSARLSQSAIGAVPANIQLKVVAVYSIGLYDYDKMLVYVPMRVAQYLLGIDRVDVATGIDVKIKDLDQSTAIGKRILSDLGPEYVFEDWQSRNKTLFQALQLERLGMALVVGLIVLVAALNIVATLIMMVLEKTRDIAILLAMGATPHQIRKIFIYQGLIIGFVGTVLGLAGGHVLSYLADTYRWISLAPDVYTIAYLPFKAEVWDSVVIAVSAILISFLATLYPSATASRLQPVVALRYE
jgi:lipoprotein-releasing system permease protein